VGREVLASVLFALVALPAAAMDMRVEGDTVTLSGPVVAADCASFGDLLARTPVKHVVLTNSGGGKAHSGYCIGGLVREHELSTMIRGRCASSCSRMWLGGVERTLEGANSRVGLHGNYDSNGGLQSDAPTRLRTWIPQHAPGVDRPLMEQWIHLPTNKWMMYFYNDKAELCESGKCTPVAGRTAQNAGLATR
jgi:hypothetical protein